MILISEGRDITVPVLTHISRTWTYVRSAKCNIFRWNLLSDISASPVLLFFCNFCCVFLLLCLAQRLSEGELACSAGRMFTLVILNLGRVGLNYFRCFFPVCFMFSQIFHFLLSTSALRIYLSCFSDHEEVRNQLNQLFAGGKENVL
jgi:hypothetical protein